MNGLALLREIEKLQAQISTLPKGYISEKSIYGKVRHYYQWKENGKLKSKYIQKGELEKYREAIAQRKELDSRLRELKGNMSSELSSYGDYESDIFVGSERLLRFGLEALSFDRRDCYAELQGYLKGDPTSHVCLVFGLRRTGKTTMLRQAILDMSAEDLARTAYIKVSKQDTMASINKDLKKLASRGCKFVFIDEATLMSDFIDSASLFSDVYAAQGMKVVLSGTDSLGFWLANHEELYDRARTIHTTFIPFKEHSRLLGIDDIDEYIRYGGTLKAGEVDFDDPDIYAEDATFRSPEHTRRYIDTAIAKNIQRSLLFYDSGNHFRNLRGLYRAGELTNAINRIVEHMNREFTKDIILCEFESHDLGSAAQILRKTNNILDDVDTQSITERLAQILDVKNPESYSVQFTDLHAAEIKEYLCALELVVDSPERFSSASAYTEPTAHPIFTQPGMRFSQAQALVHSLMKDKTFLGCSEEVKDLVTKRLLDEVRGRMLEDIVLLETQKALLGQRDVFKFKFAVGEFDMVIYDRKTNTCEIYEVKHTCNSSDGQFKHLINKEKIALTEQRYGKITKQCVLYRGKSFDRGNGVLYQNVEQYLKGLEMPLQRWAVKSIPLPIEQQMDEASSLCSCKGASSLSPSKNKEPGVNDPR